ncbi:MAG: ADP-ribosylglycohydrolase family protein, partial [Planctomycetota bacterium]
LDADERIGKPRIQISSGVTWSRRRWLRDLAVGLVGPIGMVGPGVSSAGAVAANPKNDRAVGLLLGSLLGDAIGGPLEFATEEMRRGRVVGARRWNPSRRLDADTIAEISKGATLMAYDRVRPDVAPYGPWVANAPAGTLTDDSRWKVILIRAMRAASEGRTNELTRAHVAEAICEFRPRTDRAPDAGTQRLIDEGLREYRYAANWVLGKRDPQVALPLDRLWAGIPNCSGQMMLLPLAIKHAGHPEAAYRESFELNFIDSAGAKDIASVLVAALASVLGEEAESMTADQRWDKAFTTMKTLDPLRHKEVPFAGRPLDKWLRLVESILKKADGRPAVAYQLLETEAKPVYFWDAHFTMVVALVLIKLCHDDAMCSLAMAIDFGHDTDSYAQLIGAFCGAIHGSNVFPEGMRHTLEKQLKDDYGENVNEWSSFLASQNPHTEK